MHALLFTHACTTGLERSSAKTLGAKCQSQKIRRTHGCRRGLEGKTSFVFHAPCAPLQPRAFLMPSLQECEPLFAASKVVAQNICQNEKCTPDRSTWGCAPGCNFQVTHDCLMAFLSMDNSPFSPLLSSGSKPQRRSLNEQSVTQSAGEWMRPRRGQRRRELRVSKSRLSSCSRAATLLS